MTLMYLIDDFMHHYFSPLASHTSVWSLEKPFTVSGIVNLPKPTYESINRFLYSGKRAEKVG